MEPRADWRRRCEDIGFSFHSVDGVYWDESACWMFSEAEIDTLETATAEVHAMCLEACDRVVREGRYAEFAIPEAFAGYVAESWREREPSVFGRFDFAWDGSGAPKLLEYNADTPTALPEASVAQWFWLQDLKARGHAGDPGEGADQFNSLHEKLIARWKALAGCIAPQVCPRRDQASDGSLSANTRRSSPPGSRLRKLARMR